MIQSFEVWIPKILFISQGILLNLQYTIISVAIGLVFGSLLALGKVSKIKALRVFCNFYTSIFRGTPLLIQLSIIYFVLPGLLGVRISAFAAAIISFSLNSSAYVSEIIRSGINAVELGQYEGGKALGLSDFVIMKSIILPQAIRKILPSLVNELVNLLKETSIISIIGESEVLRRAQMVSAEQFNYLIPMLTAAVNYYIVVMILVWIAAKLEKKFAL